MTNHKLALISVHDKTNIISFANQLITAGYHIISTGGTARLLEENDISVIHVSDVTGFPEIMDGRVKTLHPKIHGGILAERNTTEHRKQAAELNIDMIDIVVVNLYPFRETRENPLASHEDIIENIDIGGPAMIRAAAKNHRYVSILTDPADFEPFLEEVKSLGEPSLSFKTYLAGKAFAHTADYDTGIADYFRGLTQEKPERMLQLSVPLEDAMRYGENPHQDGYFYLDPGHRVIQILHGKKPSYNNYLDIDAALKLISSFSDPTVAILKHTNPCGVGTDQTLVHAYCKAFETDTQSPYGGIIVMNRPIDRAVVDEINKIFSEIIIAPSYPEDLRELLAKRKDRRLIQYDEKKLKALAQKKSVLSVVGGYLIQNPDMFFDDETQWKVVTDVHPDTEVLQALRFGWKVVSILKSNAIALTGCDRTFGLGTGQMSRIDSVTIAAMKAGHHGHNLHQAICASDGFFPFRDSIEALHKLGIKAVIQPGGSKGDEDVIRACNEFGIPMIFTGMRHFRH